MNDETQMLPSAYAAPSNIRVATIYDGMVNTRPSFTAINSDVNSSAGSPGYEGAPSHYKGRSGIQTFDVWDAYCMDPYRATAWKYFTRYKLKGSEKNDIDKLEHYLQEAVSRVHFPSCPLIDLREIKLTPAVVIPAFDIDGIMADAALDFLLSFTTRNPKTYLRASRSIVLEYASTLI